jgi:molybdopterin converting factor small subunit
MLPVLLFASYADAFGAPHVHVEVRAPCRVSDVVSALRALPGGRVLPVQPLVAVNHEWVSAEHPVRLGDEVAIIPPVAGG